MVDNGRFQRHDGSGRPRFTVDQDRLIVRSAVTTLDSSLSTIRRTTRTRYPGLTFQQDNARPHTTRVAMNCLTAHQTLPWLARSPNLSPIEHVWDMRGRRLHLPRNVDGLTRKLEQIWQEILKETIRVLYYSMSRRVAACIQARGGSTPY
ncbi:transposable element Tc1 transposase [Trichonephila clavipes]|nr:transposable element Tc1 transposase [Trichonephila clavipes]